MNFVSLNRIISITSLSLFYVNLTNTKISRYLLFIVEKHLNYKESPHVNLKIILIRHIWYCNFIILMNRTWIQRAWFNCGYNCVNLTDAHTINCFETYALFSWMSLYCAMLVEKNHWYQANNMFCVHFTKFKIQYHFTVWYSKR